MEDTPEKRRQCQEGEFMQLTVEPTIGGRRSTKRLQIKC